jgi:hypothetical protein
VVGGPKKKARGDYESLAPVTTVACPLESVHGGTCSAEIGSNELRYNTSAHCLQRSGTMGWWLRLPSLGSYDASEACINHG